MSNDDLLFAPAYGGGKLSKASRRLEKILFFYRFHSSAKRGSERIYFAPAAGRGRE